MKAPSPYVSQVLSLGLLCLGVVATHLRSDRRTGSRPDREKKSAMAGGAPGLPEAEKAALETLAYVLEAVVPSPPGYLDTVRRMVRALAREFALAPEEQEALDLAALLHHAGLPALPDSLLCKTEAPAADEHLLLNRQRRIALDLLSSLTLPERTQWLLRQFALCGEETGRQGRMQAPPSVRILCAAVSYSAQRLGGGAPRAIASAFAPREDGSLRRFGADVARAISRIAKRMRDGGGEGVPLADDASLLSRETRRALAEMATARRETVALLALTQTANTSLHMEAIYDALLEGTHALIPCASCVLFSPEKEGQFLQARAASGVNARALLGSTAQIGAYLTGRAYAHGEIMQASFLPDDLLLRNVSDAWVPFRSTLIAPIGSGDRVVGTLNLYSEEPDAFGPEARRMAQLVAVEAARALSNANYLAAAEETAYTDLLTGLPNSRFLREFLESEINRASREGMPLAVLNIDVDGFKNINDCYGHACGDQTLRDLATLFIENIRNYDRAIRYAGDEFVVILARTGRMAAETVAAKLKRAVAHYAREKTRETPAFAGMGISVGLALYPDDAPDAQGLLCRSDAAMYADKERNGGSRRAV